jgi:hypothetical protein
MSNQESFFAQEHNIEVLNKFRSRMHAIHTQDEFELARNNHIKTIIQGMRINPEEWSKLCEINIQWIGNSFIGRLEAEDEKLTKEKLDGIFAMCFRFVFELFLSIKNNLSTEFERARKFAFHNLDKFEGNARTQIEYAIWEMPVMIFKAIANSDSIKSIKDFNELAQTADKKREKWEAELAEREARIAILKSELEKYETGFNFVGLFQGFDELSKEKKVEKNIILFLLFLLSALIIAPLILEIYFVYSNLPDLSELKDLFLLSLIPTTSLIAILIYYFRVLLFNYKSVKSQLLQIELRKTLCRFIQHYSEYSSKLKQQDKESLSKFESVIFSGIVSDNEKLPSSYDGMEQLVSLIKSIKS